MALSQEIKDVISQQPENNTVLNLREQGIKDEDVEELVQWLKHKISIRTLNLSRNNLSDAGVKILAVQLPSHISSLNVSFTNAGDKALEVLLENKNLQSIDMCACAVTNAGIQIALQSLENKRINFQGNRVDADLLLAAQKRFFPAANTLRSLVEKRQPSQKKKGHTPEMFKSHTEVKVLLAEEEELRELQNKVAALPIEKLSIFLTWIETFKQDKLTSDRGLRGD